MEWSRANVLDVPSQRHRTCIICFNCARDAPWRATRHTDASFRAACAAEGKELPILFQCCIGFALGCIMVDTLHCVDQGVASHIIANICWELVLAQAWGGSTQERNVQGLMEELQAHYKSSKEASRIQGKLTVERIRTQGGWPKLKAKAAATRHCAKFALDLAIRHNSGSPHDRRRVGVVQCLVGLLCDFGSRRAVSGGGCAREYPEAREHLSTVVRPVVP